MFSLKNTPLWCSLPSNCCCVLRLYFHFFRKLCVFPLCWLRAQTTSSLSDRIGFTFERLAQRMLCLSSLAFTCLRTNSNNSQPMFPLAQKFYHSRTNISHKSENFQPIILSRLPQTVCEHNALLVTICSSFWFQLFVGVLLLLLLLPMQISPMQQSKGRLTRQNSTLNVTLAADSCIQFYVWAQVLEG